MRASPGNGPELSVPQNNRLDYDDIALGRPAREHFNEENSP